MSTSDEYPIICVQTDIVKYSASLFGTFPAITGRDNYFFWFVVNTVIVFQELMTEFIA